MARKIKFFEPPKPKRRPAPPPPTPDELHYCEVCNRLASFGFGASEKNAVQGQWFCFQHHPCPEALTPSQRSPQAA